MTTEQTWTTSDGAAVKQSVSGDGAKSQQAGLPTHNPMPRTDRGKRRHANRNDTEKKQAEAAWRRERSVRPSRYQERMGKK